MRYNPGNVLVELRKNTKTLRQDSRSVRRVLKTGPTQKEGVISHWIAAFCARNRYRAEQFGHLCSVWCKQTRETSCQDALQHKPLQRTTNSSFAFFWCVSRHVFNNRGTKRTLQEVQKVTAYREAFPSTFPQTLPQKPGEKFWLHLVLVQLSKDRSDIGHPLIKRITSHSVNFL